MKEAGESSQLLRPKDLRRGWERNAVPVAYSPRLSFAYAVLLFLAGVVVGGLVVGVLA